MHLSGANVACVLMASRPFIAKMPCGRFWMKTMMKTSTAILPARRAGPAFNEFVEHAQAERAYEAAHEKRTKTPTNFLSR
jgi:hypothetical protein